MLKIVLINCQGVWFIAKLLFNEMNVKYRTYLEKVQQQSKCSVDGFQLSIE